MAEIAPNETNLYDYLAIVKGVFSQLWNRKWIILAITAVFATVTFFYFKLNKKPVQYVANCTFMLYDSDKGINSLSSVLGANTASGTSNKDLIIYLLGSRRIIEDMLLSPAYFNGKEDLVVNHYARAHKFEETWNNHPLLKDFRFKKKQDIAYSDFQDSVLGGIVNNISGQESFDIDMKSWKMSMSYRDEDEHFAKLIVEKQIESLCAFYISRKRVKGVETVDFLQQKRDSLTNALRGTEMAFAAWKDSNQRLIKATGGAEEGKFRGDITMLNSALLESTRQLEMAKLTLLDESPIVQTIDTPKYPLPKNVTSNWKLIWIIVNLIGFILIAAITVGQKYLSDYFKKQKLSHTNN